MENKIKVGFVGLSHLGLNYLAAASKKGLSVSGIDADVSRINRLNKFLIDHDEPNLKKTIFRNKKNIFFSHNFNSLKECQVIFISEDVDTNNKGKGDFKKLSKLIKRTLKFVSKKSVLVILSQVYPGFVRKINFDKSRLYYHVETLIFGKALERALNPERIIVGSEKPKTKISKPYLNFLKKFKCPIINMKYESAELTKISINIFLASSITATNMLAQVCEKISADWEDVIPALRLDQRIGKKAYIKPGLGIAGGNIERDIYSIGEILKKKEKAFSIIKSYKENSIYMKSWVFRILKREKILSKAKNFNIGILGLAYKENTNSIKNSASINLIKKIKNKKVMVYDPVVKLRNKNRNCVQVNDIKILIKNSNVLVIMTPWKEFTKIGKNLKKFKNKNLLLIDPYRILNLNIAKRKDLKYFTIGK